MKKFDDVPTIMEFDVSNNSVTLRHAKTRVILMMIRLDDIGLGTMTRIFSDDETGYKVGDEDCDNYWIGIKPSDHAVFTERLFDRRRKLVVRSIDYSIESLVRRAPVDHVELRNQRQKLAQCLTLAKLELEGK